MSLANYRIYITHRSLQVKKEVVVARKTADLKIMLRLGFLQLAQMNLAQGARR